MAFFVLFHKQITDGANANVFCIVCVPVTADNDCV